MEAKLEEKDAADWVYRGEGAANLVLAYAGSSPAFIGKVMRLQKVARNGSPRSIENENEPALTEQEKLVWRDSAELLSSPTKDVAKRLYVKHVMAPLLAPKYVDAGMRIPITRDFLECIEKKVISWRPAWRVDAAKVDTKCDSVLLMSDHSLFPHGGPCLSVEIKPKCGFIPLSRHIEEGHALKRRTTRFKMHQVLKLRQKEISELSEYNPLDLFSGSKDRILKAIKDLYSTPQNNFRVFLNGSIIFGGLGGGTEKTNVVIAEAFENSLKQIIRADEGLCTTSFIQLVAETVYSSRVLDLLLEVQRLDDLDIEGAIHAYYNVISQRCMVCTELDEAGVAHRYGSLHSISIDESLKIVKNYLIAATAKDCSLMISFRPSQDVDFGSFYSRIHLQSTNQKFDYKVNFIDLDLKPLKKMEDYYQLDKRIMNSYIQMMEMEHKKGNASNMEVSENINGESTKVSKKFT